MSKDTSILQTADTANNLINKFVVSPVVNLGIAGFEFDIFYNTRDQGAGERLAARPEGNRRPEARDPGSPGGSPGTGLGRPHDRSGSRSVRHHRGRAGRHHSPNPAPCLRHRSDGRESGRPPDLQRGGP